jgi:isopentenyl-diphosphate delta-isomerase
MARKNASTSDDEEIEVSGNDGGRGRGIGSPSTGETGTEDVILVDDDDRAVGSSGKLAAHQRGDLHRAVSVFVVSPRGDRVLLQRRGREKYHSRGLWSNAACTHPAPGETVETAARRCLRHEMGLAVPLHPLFVFRYRADVGGGLVEHEIDHVFWGTTSDTPHAAPQEVDAWRWGQVDRVRDELRAEPDRFTPWFRLCYEATMSAIRDALANAAA